MKINIDLEDLEECGDCGIIFNKITVKRTKPKASWDSEKYICPLCKAEIYISEEN